MKESYRILKSGGRAVICESFRRWMVTGGAGTGPAINTLIRDLEDIGFEVVYKEGTSEEDESSDVFQYLIVRKP